MIYDIVKDDIIIKEIATSESKEDLQKEYPNCEIYEDIVGVCVNDNIKKYDFENNRLKTLKEQVEEGLVEVPEGMKVNEEKNEFEKMNENERIIARLDEVPEGYEIVDDKIVKTLEFLREIKKQKIKMWYTQEKIKPVNGFYSKILGAEINGGREQYDDIMALSDAGDSFCTQFVLLDNTVATKDSNKNNLNAEIFKNICNEMTSYTTQCYWKYQSKKQEINNCKTKKELEAISI